MPRRQSLPLVLALFIMPAALLLTRTDPAAAQSSGGLTATLNATPSTVAVGQNVAIAYNVPSTVTPDMASGLTTSTIDFGDGTTADGGGVGGGEPIIGNLAHSYTDPGSYTITFSAQAPDGETASASATVTVVSQLQAPSIELRGPTSTVQPGDSISFTYSVTPATGADITGIAIVYGDGSSDMLSSPSGAVTHTYTDAGTYVALLTAVDSNGQAGAASTQVEVVSS